MEWNFIFFFNSALLGTGLAMDAFSVSMANGLNEPDMKPGRLCTIAGVFAGFQALMPLTGWFLVHTMVRYFAAFEPWIPWIALALLCWIGGNMLFDGLRRRETEKAPKSVGLGALFLQGIATSIDALSVGFTIAEYSLPMAVAAVLIIAVVTFFLCLAGLLIGKKFGTKLANKAQILGGVILITIGLEIFLTGVL